MELDAPGIRSGAPASSAETSLEVPLEVPPVLIVSCSTGTERYSSTVGVPARVQPCPGADVASQIPFPVENWQRLGGVSPDPAQMWAG
jgi:hypothetical protein